MEHLKETDSRVAEWKTRSFCSCKFHKDDKEDQAYIKKYRDHTKLLVHMSGVRPGKCPAHGVKGKTTYLRLTKSEIKDRDSEIRKQKRIDQQERRKQSKRLNRQALSEFKQGE